MTTTCEICNYSYPIAPSKRLNPCPNCLSIATTGESLKEIARRKTKASMEKSRLKSLEKQALNPPKSYTIPKQSAKGRKQAGEVAATKKKLKDEARDSGFIECSGCGKHFKGLDGSHVVPVSQSSALASDPANITLLCRACHTAFENGTVPEMIKLKCFVTDLKYMFEHDTARFWNIHYRLVEEYNARPTGKMERVLGKLERFEE